MLRKHLVWCKVSEGGLDSEEIEFNTGSSIASLKVHRVSSTGFENVPCWCSLLQDAILIQEYSSDSMSATSKNQFNNQLNIWLKDHYFNIFQLIHCIHSNLKSHNPSCSFGTPLRRALFEVSRHSTQGRLKKKSRGVAAQSRRRGVCTAKGWLENIISVRG